MISETEFLEYIQAICKRPSMYTPTGSFFESMSFLEGYGSGVNVGEEQGLSPFGPFKRWMGSRLGKEEAYPANWHDFLNYASSEEQAFIKLPVLYEQYLKETAS